MKPRPEALNQFRKLYQEEFGDELSPEEAEAMWMRVMDIFLLICKRPRPRGLSSEEEDCLEESGSDSA